MPFFQRYINQIRACPICGYSLGNIFWLCEVCEVEFLKRLSLKKRFIGLSRHHYLIDWMPGDPFVDQLVYSFKGSGLFQSYLNLALIYSSFKGVCAPDVVYYPSKGIKDHGTQWGEAFSEVFSCPSHALEISGGKKQSLLERSERSKRDFKNTKVCGRNPYFVDDIVTTGATAKAAFKGFNQQGKLTIWSLFYRRAL